MAPACCGHKPDHILAVPDIQDMVAKTLEPVLSFNFGSRAATWLACRTCGQRWLHVSTCMGHRDWDIALRKCDAPEPFFQLARAALPP
jgi:hypothetical protein